MTAQGVFRFYNSTNRLKFYSYLLILLSTIDYSMTTNKGLSNEIMKRSHEQKYIKKRDIVSRDTSSLDILCVRTAELGSYPYHAAIIDKVYVDKFGFMDIQCCGGSIIGESIVLTAAHCTYKKETFIYVIAGVISLLEYGRQSQRREVSAVVAHPNYDDMKKLNDISLVFCQTNFTFNQYVQPIIICNRKLIESENCVVTGWSIDDVQGLHTAKGLQAVSVDTETRSFCEKQMANLSEKILCTGLLKQRNFCFNDSGGPLVCKQELLGVVSHGFLPNDQCPYGNALIFMQMHYYSAWIADNINMVTGFQRHLRSDLNQDAGKDFMKFNHILLSLTVVIIHIG